jgi:hypothetical protein
LTAKKNGGGPRRDPPPATACQSWYYPDLLVRPSQASSISRRLAELKCCASLCFRRRAFQRIYLYTMIARAHTTKRPHSPRRSHVVDEGRRPVRFRQNIPRAPRGPPRWVGHKISMLRLLLPMMPFDPLKPICFFSPLPCAIKNRVVRKFEH